MIKNNKICQSCFDRFANTYTIGGRYDQIRFYACHFHNHIVPDYCPYKLELILENERK